MFSSSNKNRVLKENDFEGRRLKMDSVVLVLFFARWCETCRAARPILDTFGERFPALQICEMFADENEVVFDALRIRSLPTLVLFKNGERISSASGPIGVEEMCGCISRAFGSV